ncbi:HSP20-like chaperone [Neohortaea acidophila]|uniref:HSP20-like chaperone n=1 Tax=Neohortaea acidophila TaxID=245834 RepID=A0A6A6Q0T0_9PEZI|nr:HSP20-like chaperone [Neohortaea acidophila]KAF2485596.1 HSP20-like chaperone [Neohortaea acidophila]
MSSRTKVLLIPGLPNAWRDARIWTMPHRGRNGRAHGWGHGGGPGQRGQEVPVQDDEDMLTPTSSDGEPVPPTAPDHHRHHGGRRGGARGFGKGRGGFGGRGRGGPHGHGPHAHHHHHHHHTGDENGLSGDEMCRGPPGMGGRGRFGGRGGGGHGGRGRGRGCGMGRGGGGDGASRDIDNDKAGEVEETSRTASAEPICRRPAGMRHLGPLPANPEHNDKFTPETDFFNHPEAYIVHVSLPGAKKEDIEVNWVAERSILRITGEVKRPADEDVLKNMITDERKAGKFERRIRLGNWVNPASVDVDGITAKLEDGILRVEVPKLEAEFVEIKKVDIN